MWKPCIALKHELAIIEHAHGMLEWDLQGSEGPLNCYVYSQSQCKTIKKNLRTGDMEEASRLKSWRLECKIPK